MNSKKIAKQIIKEQSTKIEDIIRESFQNSKRRESKKTYINDNTFNFSKENFDLSKDTYNNHNNSRDSNKAFSLDPEKEKKEKLLDNSK